MLQAQNQLVTDQNNLKTDQNTLNQINDVQLIQQQKDNANAKLQQAQLMLHQAMAQGWQRTLLAGMINYYSVCTNIDGKLEVQFH